jgi:hypothetical protein
VIHRIIKFFKHTFSKQQHALPEVTISLFYGINQFNKTAILQYDSAIALQIEPYHLGLYARILEPGAMIIGFSIAQEDNGVGIVIGSGRIATVFGQESTGILFDQDGHQIGHALVTVQQA